MIPTPKHMVYFGLSLLSGPATQEQFEARLFQCQQCPKLVSENNNQWCGGGCGCGKKPRAELKVKLSYSYARCPLRKPGFSNSKQT